MADTSKKKPRKSKLVVRECLDSEEVKNTTTEMQEENSQIKDTSKMLLPRLKNSMNETYVETSPAPVQFSVQVDVETFDDNNHCVNIDKEEEYNHATSYEYSTLLNEVIITNNAIRKEVEKLSSSKNYIDKQLAVECCNQWGKNQKPHVNDHYEMMIQDVLFKWRNWNSVSKIRSTVQTYKCNICSIGWWYLDPFREHIKIHKEVSLSIDVFLHECSVVAAQGQWFESMCLCQVEGNCPKCLKTYEQHLVQKNGTPFYHCDGCSGRFPTCSLLFQHEGACVCYERIIYQNTIPEESMWTCQICNVPCLTQDRYEEHMILGHSVRSDLPTLMQNIKVCGYCALKYHVFSWHVCSKRTENFKCKYCFRKFQTKLQLSLHDICTKKDVYCRICKGYLKSECMEVEHLLKHKSQFCLVYKCWGCLDNVLLADELLLQKHKDMWHSKRSYHKKPDSYCDTIVVPRSCMSYSWVEGVDVGDMVIGNYLGKSLVESWKSITDVVEILIPENLPEIIKDRKRLQEARLKRNEDMEKMCTDLKNRMLKRAWSNNSRISTANSNSNSNDSDDVLGTLERLKNEDDRQNSSCSIVSNKSTVNDETLSILEGLKNEDSQNSSVMRDVDNSVLATDEDILATQNSVDALLNYINVKDEIMIEESNWEIITIDDTSDGDSQPASQEKCYQNRVIKKESSNMLVKQESVNQENLSETGMDEIESQGNVGLEEHSQESVQQKVNLAIVKKEPESKYEEEECFKDKTGIDIHTEVAIKEENEDCQEFDEDIENKVKEEQHACFEELSKVFRATKHSGTLELSGISSYEDATIKEELIDQDDYEDDIIMLHNASNLDITVTADNVKTEEPEVKLSQGPYQKVITDSGKVVVNREKKMYECKTCGFVGEHKEYSAHRKKKKHSGRTARKHADNVWSHITCTKCDRSFKSMRLYFQHFTAHNMKFGRCPRCGVYFRDSSKAVDHLKGHIKNSFVRIQVLNASTYYTSKTTGLYQCKVCQDKVEFKKFFTHWEQHLEILQEPIQQEPLIVDEPAPGEAPLRSPDHYQLSAENIKILLDQLTHRMDSRDGALSDKRCVLCARAFMRRNDVKRHVIEHLVRDAHTRGPPLACQLCGHRATKPAAYKTHMRNHAALPVFRCEMCDKCFSDSSNFAKHKKVHNLHVLSICDLCKKKFHSKQGLEKHLEMHRSTKPISCSKCDRVLYSESAYKKHSKMHEKRTINRLCRICMVRFSTMRSMWNHMWEVHRQRLHKADCPVCEQSFRKMQDVRAHMREAHDAPVRVRVRVRVRGKNTRPDGAR